MPTVDLPLVAYIRVSTAGQVASGIGQATQHKAIADFAEANDLAIGGWYEDAGRSGSSRRRRVGLQAALAEIAAGRAAGIIAAKIDRLGRSSADVMGLVEQAHRERWRLIALDVGLDTTTPAGELVAAALAMAARFEFRRISERQLEKNQELRRRGEPRGRTAAPREVADRILALRAGGATWRAIAGVLNQEGFPTARGGAQWYGASARSAAVTRQLELDAQAISTNDEGKGR
jgi:DNA invertase Pin-like site-specific DNA recombinase